MAVEKFKTSVALTAKASDESSLNEVKKDFENCKNPLQSSCPFKDGQEVKFEGFQVIEWSHSKFGSGKYIAIKFEGLNDAMSLSSAVKSVTAYAAADSEDMTDIANKGGLSALISDKGWSSDLLDEIVAFFKEGKFAIKLTPFYVPLRGVRGKRNLINVVKKS